MPAEEAGFGSALASVLGSTIASGLGSALVSAGFKDKFNSGLVERAGRLYLDLAAVNKKQLLDSGIRAENIFDAHFCTSCANGEFFSFRKEGKETGRMLSVMMLE